RGSGGGRRPALRGHGVSAADLRAGVRDQRHRWGAAGRPRGGNRTQPASWARVRSGGDGDRLADAFRRGLDRMSSAVAERTETEAAVQPRRLAWWKIALGPWMVGVILAAFLYVGAAQNFMVPDAARIVFFHVPVSILLFVWY